MAGEEISRIQARVNALLERYKITNDRAARRELPVSLRVAIAELDSAEASTRGTNQS